MMIETPPVTSVVVVVVVDVEARIKSSSWEGNSRSGHGLPRFCFPALPCPEGGCGVHRTS